MPDLTPDQAIEKLKTLPEDRQRAILGKLSPEQKKAILGKLQAVPKTSGELKKSAAAVAEPTFTSDPQGYFTRRAELLGEETQGLLREASDKTKHGTLARIGYEAAAGIPAIGEVANKAVAGLFDPKAAAAISLGVFDPAIPAAYFATQGTAALTGLTPGVEKGDLSPENVQNALLSGATVAGAGGAAAESTAGAPLIRKVGELRESAKQRFQSIARNQVEASQGAKQAVSQTAQEHADALVKNRQDRVATVKENILKEKQATTKFEQKRLAVSEQNKAAEAKGARKAELAKTVDEQSQQLGNKIEQVEQNVAKEANRKFDAVREKVGNPEAPADPLIQSVKNVETNILQGIPENIKEFRAILSLEGEDNPTLYANGQEVKAGDPNYETIKEAYKTEGILEEGKPVTWDKLQSLKSRIDARLRKGRGMNGDLKRGLRSVRESVIDEMGKMAEAKGAAAEWGEARNFWRQYKEDFHEPSGPSGSGSPVASSLDAVDPKNIRQPFLRTQSTLGNRGVEILRKYPQFGGTEAATLAEQLVSGHGEMTAITKSATATKPMPEVLRLPERKPAPPIPEKPTVDIEEAARKKIAQAQSRIGRLNAWDVRVMASSTIAGLLSPFLGFKGGVELGGTFVLTKMALGRALDKPAVVNWLAKTPPRELEALQKLPNANLVNIKGALTEAAIQSGAKDLSPTVQQFLGPANVQRILSGTASPAVPPRNRKEALALIGR